MKVKKKQFSFLVNVTNLHTSFVYEHRVRSFRMKMKSPTYTYISLSIKKNVDENVHRSSNNIHK